MRSTVKFAKARLVRFEASKVYSFSHFGYRPVMRVGVYGKKV